MKISIQSIALLLSVPLILFACNKEENFPEPPISHTALWDCHHQMAWDSLKTKNALIGEWEWEYIACAWNLKAASYEEFKGLTVEFKPDNTLDVKENGQTIETSNWKVVDGDADLFALSVDTEVAPLFGRILFCENRVVFGGSYIDLCDNYFRRKE